MAISVYWWRPTQPLEALASEVYNHGAAWVSLYAKHRRFCNFGDELNALVLPELLGQHVKWTTLQHADVVGIGSILNAYSASTSHAVVLGSGVRSPSTLHPLSQGRLGRVFALRGILSAKALNVDQAKAIGDPGLAVRSLVSAHRQRRRGVVIIPHFASYNSRKARRLFASQASRGAYVLSPNQSALDIAAAVSSARLVLTSSLHGLVFADALQTPVQLIDIAGRRTEPDFKYLDYQSVIGGSLGFRSLPESFDEATVSAWVDETEQRSAVIKPKVDEVVERLFSLSRSVGV